MSITVVTAVASILVAAVAVLPLLAAVGALVHQRSTLREGPERPVGAKGELRRMSVWGEVQPHIDPGEIAKILLDAAMEQVHRERAEREQDEAA